MRRVAPLVLLAAVTPLVGCDSGLASITKDLTRPSASGRFRGDLSESSFTPDSKGFFAYTVPLGKDPAARPRVGEYVLWDVTTGKEWRRLPPDEKIDLYKPGTADGKHWLAFGRSGRHVGRFLLLELDPAKRLLDVPGAPNPEKSVSRPNFNEDFTRLAYSDYAKDEKDRKGHVLAREGGAWKEILSVPGEKAVLSFDGRRVATLRRGGFAITLHVYSVPEGKPLWEADVKTFGLIGFTRDGKYVLQDDQSDWKVFDANTGTEKLTLKHGHNCPKAAYADGRVLTADMGDDGLKGVTLVTWDVASGKELGRVVLPYPASLSRTHGEPFTAPRLAVARAHENRPIPGRKGSWLDVWTVEAYDPAKASTLTTLKVTFLSNAAVSPDGRVAVVIGHGGPSFFRLPAP